MQLNDTMKIRYMGQTIYNLSSAGRSGTHRQAYPSPYTEDTNDNIFEIIGDIHQRIPAYPSSRNNMVATHAKYFRMNLEPRTTEGNKPLVESSAVSSRVSVD